MSKRNEYVLTFRGAHVQTFYSVHEEQAVLLGYRRYPGEGQTHLSYPYTGKIAFKPEVLTKMKTVAALKRSGVSPRFDTYPGQSFIITVKPGTTEITEAALV